VAVSFIGGGNPEKITDLSQVIETLTNGRMLPSGNKGID
jgi:hypothetical protein